MRLLKIIILSTFLSACAQHLTSNSPGSENSQAPAGSGSVADHPERAAKKTRSTDPQNGGAMSSTHSELTDESSSDQTKNNATDQLHAESQQHLKVSQLTRPKNITGERIDAQTRRGAVIIFLRSSVVASAVNAQVYEVDNGTPTLVGDIQNNTRLHHELNPGRHVFMLIADSIDYLVVDVKASHTYYAVVKPSMGVWKPKFNFIPIKATLATDTQSAKSEVPLHFGDEEVNAMLSAMTPIVYSKEFTQRKLNEAEQAKIEQRYIDSWQDWSAQQEKDISRKSLSRTDGRKVH
ncbi:hypothetical protein TDB9533_04411 [Thalassocella blandensis]|nr:hypothetical protein TDB9533_04411 [Thalassocella blandensis]